MSDLFDNLNDYKNLEVVSAPSPDSLKDILKSLPGPIQIISIVSNVDGSHSAYLRSNASVKVRTEPLKEN